MKIKRKSLTILILSIGTLIISACSHQQPVLYPNSHYLSVGKLAAEVDIQHCVDLAAGGGAMPDKSTEVLTRTAKGSLLGGFTGAATGAVYGHAAKGATAGAAGGGAFGMSRALIESGKPNPVFRAFVNRCLRDKGYDLIGWG